MACKYYSIIPANSDSNAFIHLTRQAIEGAGYTYAPFKALRSKKMKGQDRFILLNWYEELPSSNAFLQIGVFLKRLVRAFLLLMSGTKIVVVIHNIAPHDGLDRLGSLLFVLLRRFVCSVSSRIVILCDATEAVLQKQLGPKLYGRCSKRIAKVPHPSYRGYYPERDIDFKSLLEIDEGSFVCLTLGIIRKYKGVELVLEAAKRLETICPKAVFVVAGKCSNQDYLIDLKQKCAGVRNVRLYPKFVADEDMYGFITGSDILMLPYSLESTLNSGNFILGSSFARSAICPKIGTVLEFPDDTVYSYLYKSPSEHVDCLTRCVTDAYRLWETNREQFLDKGRTLATIVENECSIDRLSYVYSNLFGESC